jgi:hypothetical protein
MVIVFADDYLLLADVLAAVGGSARCMEKGMTSILRLV